MQHAHLSSPWKVSSDVIKFYRINLAVGQEIKYSENLHHILMNWRRFSLRRSLQNCNVFCYHRKQMPPEKEGDQRNSPEHHRYSLAAA